MSIENIHDEPEHLKESTLLLFVGEKLGSGAYRRVYEIAGRDDVVLKLEHEQRFNNVSEWLVWEAVKGTANEKWFAPCIDISGSGHALIQRRTEVFDENGFREAVEAIPAFFDDIHFGNWGMMDGRPVCHDYGCTLLLENAVKGSRMKKVKHAAHFTPTKD